MAGLISLWMEAILRREGGRGARILTTDQFVVNISTELDELYSCQTEELILRLRGSARRPTIAPVEKSSQGKVVLAKDGLGLLALCTPPAFASRVHAGAVAGSADRWGR